MIPQKKEIIYTPISRIAVIVAEGEYKGVKYVCVNRGIHPCAYVFCTQEFLDKHATEYETIDGICVHGGVSFIGNANELLGLEDYDHPCFGWDYGHVGDWEGYMSEDENTQFGHKKYTTDMIISDCENAIDQYLKVLEDDNQPYIDLKTVNSSYAINQSPRRKYEGEITTKDDLKSIIQLFDIPVEIV